MLSQDALRAEHKEERGRCGGSTNLLLVMTFNDLDGEELNTREN